jgi:hypothetical protein
VRALRGQLSFSSNAKETNYGAERNAHSGQTLLHPNNHILTMIDLQSRIAFATKSINTVKLRNNAALLAASARIFNMPAMAP